MHFKEDMAVVMVAAAASKKMPITKSDMLMCGGREGRMESKERGEYEERGLCREYIIFAKLARNPRRLNDSSLATVAVVRRAAAAAA